MGIPPDKLSYIFDKFTQADSSTTRRFGGTGLGLAICRMLVQMMNGSIWAESESGHGSTFHFVLPLPLAEQSEPAATPASPKLSAGPPLRILVAEDNSINQEVIREVLTTLGHGVTIVDDGRQAVQAAFDHSYDVILMDVQMPEMDGYEATAEIRRREQVSGGHRAIVAMTANAMKGDADLCLSAGMDGYTSKPIDVELLFRTIESVIARQAAATHQRPTPTSTG